MLFSDVRPFVRHVQRIKINGSEEDAKYARPVIARDCRLFFCMGGSGQIVLSNYSLSVSKGDAIIIPSAFEYSLFKEGEYAEFICVNFDYTWVGAGFRFPIPPVERVDFNPDKVIEHIDFTDEPQLNEPLSLQKVQRLEDRLLRLLDSYRKKVIFYENECSYMFGRILVECLRTKKSLGRSYRRSVFEGIVEYIGENYNKPLTNKKIAEIFGYNQNYVSDLFKVTTGIPLHKYVMNLRIEKAVELLEFGDKSVMEVAEECGFYDIYHFSKAFKSATGVSPTKYERIDK